MPPKPQPKPDPAPARADLGEAVAAGNAALAERNRLAALRPTLMADLKAAQTHRDAVAAEVKAAELEAVLSGEPPFPDLAQKAEEARRALTLADNDVTRLGHALDGLPGKLDEAESAILAAEERLAPLVRQRAADGAAEFEAEVLAALQALVPLVLRWKARASTMGIPSTFLAGLMVPGITTHTPLLSGMTVRTVDGSPVPLDQAWRDDPDAAALHAALAPAARTDRALALEASRIRTVRRDAEIAGARKPWGPQRWNTPPAPPYTPPKGAGPGRSHTVTQPGAPREVGQPFQPSAGIRFPGSPVPAGTTDQGA